MSWSALPAMAGPDASALLPATQALCWGAAVFLLPGGLVLACLGSTRPREGSLATAFALSLALLSATMAACLLASLSIDAGAPLLGMAAAASAVVARRMASSASVANPAPEPVQTTEPVSRPRRSLRRRTALVQGCLACGAVAAAVLFAPLGSIDRWWYLAYIRGFAEAPVVTLAEPFLGSGEPFARFGLHPWLFGMALWSRLGHMDPQRVMEAFAPALATLAAISATRALATELFGRGARARNAVAATILCWGGGLVPVLARAAEDKVLAAAALSPLVLALFLRAVRSGASTPWRGPSGSAWRVNAALLGVGAIACAAMHALVYAFTLLVALPAALLLATMPHRERGPAVSPGRRAAAGAAVILLAAAIAPAIAGLTVRSRLHDIGADFHETTHPVVRVHEARERLVKLPVGGYAVHPRLLLHPFTLLSLAGAPLLLRRRRNGGQSAAGEGAGAQPMPTPAGSRVGAQEAERLPDWPSRWLLGTATAIPLMVAFVPPLPELAGSVIPPWMVYRVLWMLPLPLLAAEGAANAAALVAGFASRVRGSVLPASRANRIEPAALRGEGLALLVLLLLSATTLATATHERLAEARGRAAAPQDADFTAMLAALRDLPTDAVVVAAPELSERLPGLAGRRVLAALDRSTVVFSGSRDRGEARLRARAAVLAGDPDASLLLRRAGLRASHVLYDPKAPHLPACGEATAQGGRWALCRLAWPARAEGDAPVALQPTEARGPVLADAACTARGVADARDPWITTPPIATCTIELPGRTPSDPAGFAESASREAEGMAPTPTPANGEASGDAGEPMDNRVRRLLALRIATRSGRASDELRISVVDARGRRGFASVRVVGSAITVLALPEALAGSIQVQVGSAFLPRIDVRSVQVLER